MKGSKFFLMVAMIVLGGCQTSGPTKSRFAGQVAPAIPAGYTPARAVQLELTGENCCAQPLPNGQQLIYLSRNRPRHEHFQVYIYDDQTKQERRLTYHDGDDQGPTWDARTNRIFYSSTTDYLKEKPQFLLNALGRPVAETPAPTPRPLWRLQPFDLYAAGRDGTAISRLSHEEGFEGEMTLNPAKPEMLFTLVRGVDSVLYRASTDGSDVRPFIKGDGLDSEAKFSPDGREVVWVRASRDGKSSQLWIAKSDGRKARALTDLAGLQLSPAWTANGQDILFSSNSAEAANFELFLIRKDGSCVRRLTYELGFDGLPSAKSDGKQILFTSDRSGPYQLFEMDLLAPACP